MPTNTTTYSFQKPVVGADEDAWGGYLNGNWDKVDDLFDGTTPVTGIDINSGTLDGVTIGGTTAGAGTFTTLTANTSITGTLATAAQTNITSVGTLTSLDVGGTVTADGLTVDLGNTTDVDINGTDGGGIQFSYNGVHQVRIDSGNNDGGVYHAPTGKNHTFKTDGKNRLKIGDNGDISFYEDTGTTAKFFWDASAESLGIGTSSPSAKLEVHGASGGIAAELQPFANDDIVLNIRNATANQVGYIQAHSDSISIDGDYTKFSTSGTERMRIDSSGNLLVGTTSADPRNFSSGTYGIRLFSSQPEFGVETMYINRSTGTDGNIITFRKDSTTVGSIGTNTSNANFQIYNALTSHVGLEFGSPNIMPTNNSGVLTDGGAALGSPSYRFSDLYLSGTVQSDGALSGFTNGYNFISGGNATNNGSNIFVYGGSHASNANTTIFRNGSSETMRIDSSGNLLVGKTADNWGTTGVQVHGYGVVAASRNGHVVNLNRETTDGDIARFQKDGTTVGSIGNRATQIYIETPTKTGLDFAGDILPRYNGSLDNGVNVDLGSSGYRFKDLYLSGGVYLGGTGSANKLDDYEEGTWTPSDGSGAGLTFTNTVGTYTKIGRFVFVLCELQYPSTSDTSNMNINGLPFAPADTFRYGGVMAYTTDSEAGLGQITTNTGTKIIIRENGTANALHNNELSLKTLRFSISYETNV